MFGKVVSTLFYIAGVITLAVGVMISAMIIFNLPAYVIPLFIGGSLVAAGAVTQYRLHPVR